MAKLLTINSITYREGINEIGDVVEVREDSKIQSSIEFDIIQVSGTKIEVEAAMAESITKDFGDIDYPTKYSHSTESDGNIETSVNSLYVKPEWIE